MNKTLKRFLALASDYWQPVFLSIAAFVSVTVLYLYKLGSLTRGVDQKELSLHNLIVSDGIGFLDLLRASQNLVFQFGSYLLQFTPFAGAGSPRLISVAFAITAVVAFYYIVRHWFTSRLSLLATVLFATSTWLLHVGRYAEPVSGYLLLMVLIAGWVWAQAHLESRFAFPVFIIVAAACLYVPGLALIITPLVIWQWGAIRQYLRRLSWLYVGIGSILALTLALPLVTTLVWPLQHGSVVQNIQAFMGLPNGLPTLETLFSNLINVPIQLFGRHSIAAQYGIIGPPLVDFFSMIMFVIGLIVSVRDWRLDRSKLLLYLLLASWLFVGVTGMLTIVIFLPIVYLFTAIGLGFMLVEWFKVFPRNPLAKWVGFGLVGAALCVVTAYNLRSYFVAWPYTDEARSAYSSRLTK